MNRSFFRFMVLTGLFLVQTVFVGCKLQSGYSKPRIIVSSDIGGTDFDDYQSFVHLFVYSDRFDIEGLVSSPFGDGRVKHIHEAIDAYEKDYPSLITYTNQYPTPRALRQVVKQGALDTPGPIGYSTPTEGSEWIVECARSNDPRPLNILIWGGIEDLAQALHDAPDILPKLRVFFIGGPNKKWSVDAYQYIADNFPSLWMIESNATYRGWFVGGNQEGEWGNSAFVEEHVKNVGALGEYFYQKGKTIKMGDTPSLTYLLGSDPSDPAQPSWGGQYVRAWDRPHKIFDRLTNKNDSIEQFGVLEIKLPFVTDTIKQPYAIVHFDKDYQAQFLNDTLHFLFSPQNADTYRYRISSNIKRLDNLEGEIVSYQPPASNANHPSSKYINWWTDDPSPQYYEKGQMGIKTLNCWRVDFLKDFAERMKRCNIKNQ